MSFHLLTEIEATVRNNANVYSNNELNRMNDKIEELEHSKHELKVVKRQIKHQTAESEKAERELDAAVKQKIESNTSQDRYTTELTHELRSTISNFNKRTSEIGCLDADLTEAKEHAGKQLAATQKLCDKEQRREEILLKKIRERDIELLDVSTDLRDVTKRLNNEYREEEAMGVMHLEKAKSFKEKIMRFSDSLQTKVKNQSSPDIKWLPSDAGSTTKEVGETVSKKQQKVKKKREPKKQPSNFDLNASNRSQGADKKSSAIRRRPSTTRVSIKSMFRDAKKKLETKPPTPTEPTGMTLGVF
eukprot:718094_1